MMTTNSSTESSPLGARACVLIVGAGPTGLALANALATYGVAFDIVDAKAAPERDSKALTINSASRYGLDLLGIGAEVGVRGVPLRRALVHWQGRRIAAIDFWRASPRWGCFVAQPQADTERELEAVLRRQGHQVQRSVRLERARQTSDCVEVELATTDGKMQRRHYDYVVGCDGKHSVVARNIGARFKVTEYAMHLVLGDFPLRLDGPTNEATYHVWDDLFFIFVPLGQEMWRVVLKRNGDVPSTPVTADELMHTVNTRLGRDVFLGPPTWLSRAPLYQRFADRLRQNRILLAGDAAHLYSPIGGTGMNTGLQDALQLAWRLAYLLAGVGTPDLLDDYERLRLEGMLANGEVTDRSTRLITRLERDPALLAPLLPLMKNRSMARKALPLAYSGLAQRYRSLEARHAGCGGLCQAWPEIRQALLRAQGQVVRKPALPVLHLVLDLAEVDATKSPLPAEQQAWALGHTPLLHCVALVRSQPGGRACGTAADGLASGAPTDSLRDGGGLTIVSDDGGRLARQAGMVKGEALLLLPDGIVAWRGPWPDGWRDMAGVVDALLRPSSSRQEASHAGVPHGSGRVQSPPSLSL